MKLYIDLHDDNSHIERYDVITHDIGPLIHDYLIVRHMNVDGASL